MHSIVQPNSMAALKLPSETIKVLRIKPNSTISLGKYGSFPSNLIIHRPYYLTYEVLDKRPGENFSRLRVVPSFELYADVFAEEDAPGYSSPGDEADRMMSATDGTEFSLAHEESGNFVVQSDHELINENIRQTLSFEEIEALKRDGTSAGKDLIKKLMLSHMALDQKTTFSLAKYKILKTRKYIRRFQVLPVDIPNFTQFQLEEKDETNILDMRQEMMALVGCWGNVHYGGEDVFLPDSGVALDQGQEAIPQLNKKLLGGRWLVVDDMRGLFVGAMAERMGILYPEDAEVDGENAFEKAPNEDINQISSPTEKRSNSVSIDAAAQREPANSLEVEANGDVEIKSTPGASLYQKQLCRRLRNPQQSDFSPPYSQTNTLTVLHSASQPNLSFLNYFGFDITDPNHPPHPLLNHLIPISLLQLRHPELDSTYRTPPPSATAEELSNMKGGKRGAFHRKRRRYTRLRYAVESTRAGNFSGLVCASTMNPISILRETLPLLAGGAPVAIYSPTIEPLAELADCLTVGRRAAWASNPPPEVAGKTLEELERWPGSEDFPINPSLLLGPVIQTSRAKPWQVLPGRTHPLMTIHGGPEGFVFTGWRAKPAEGRVEARGKFTPKRRKVETDTAQTTDCAGTR